MSDDKPETTPPQSDQTSFTPPVDKKAEQLYPIKLLRENDGPQGTYPAGTVIQVNHRELLTHCTPGFGNAPRLAEPQDDAGRQLVAQQMEVHGQSVDQLRRQVIDAAKSKPRTAEQRRSRQRLKELAQAYNITEANRL